MVVARRIKRVSLGNYGDYRSVGAGVLELRFHQGWRIYFCEVGGVVVLLFCEGDKSSQEKDIVVRQRNNKRILDENGLEHCSKR
jgi:putative addiction module killer protein